MNTFYIKLDEENRIVDIVEFATRDYVPIELTLPLPVGINAGWYKYENNMLIKDVDSSSTHIDKLPIFYQELDQLKKTMMTSTEQLAIANINAMTLDEVRELKIASLKEYCSAAIFKGFYSKTIDKEFGFNAVDQVNLTQQMVLIVAAGGKLDREIEWKTLDGQVTKMNVEQFLSIIKEAEAHKRKEQEKYWVLEMRLKNSITKEEILAINW